MMKFLFVCLLIANGALYAYQQGYLETWLPSGHEPARAKKQFNTDKIKIIGVSESSSVTAVSTTATTAEPSSTSAGAATTTTTLTAAAAIPTKKPDILACTEVGNFSADEAARFEKQLAALTLGDRVSKRAIEEAAGHLVFIPSQGNKELADKKAGQLRRMGVTNFSIILDDAKMRWGIALGSYKSQDAAKARLTELNDKGVQSARIGTASASSKVAFRLHNLEATTKDAIVKIKGEFPQQEVRTCS